MDTALPTTKSARTTRVCSLTNRCKFRSPPLPQKQPANRPSQATLDPYLQRVGMLLRAVSRQHQGLLGTYNSARRRRARASLRGIKLCRPDGRQGSRMPGRALQGNPLRYHPVLMRLYGTCAVFRPRSAVQSQGSRLAGQLASETAGLSASGMLRLSRQSVKHQSPRSAGHWGAQREST